ncbi:MAG: alpha/beta hydrolase [Chloroflexi bacterium]|nr:alpha/beta hydrolase [Chloroflexota bacterium]
MLSEERVQGYRAAERRFWEHFGATPKEYFLDLARPKVKVRMLEVGEGAPVLFVHGGPNAGSTWTPIASQMRDFRCLILDRPGCGLSEPVDYSAYSTGDLHSLAVDVLTSVLDALHIERLSVVASSFGGAWTLWLAGAHPSRVVRIIQEGCPALVPGIKIPSMMRMLAFGPLGRFIARQRATEKVMQRTFRQLGHTASLTAGRFPAAWMDWGLHLMNDTDTMRNDVAAIQRVATWRGFRREVMLSEDLLRRVSQPTLFLWGEADPFGGVEIGRRTCATMPNAKLISFPASGHLPWLDDPDKHAQTAREFLQAQ